MKIRRLNLTIPALSKLPENERTFLLLAGHMQNEFVTLNKIFAWCISPAKSAMSIEAVVNGSQGFIISKILAGKLHEGWQLMNKAYFGSKLSLALAPLLHESARLSLDGLNSYFSKPNLIYTVRNSFSFHYSAEEISRHWHKAASEPDFDFFIGNEYGNTFHQASETAVSLAVLNGINPNDRAAALRAFLDDVQKNAALMTSSLASCLSSSKDASVKIWQLSESKRMCAQREVSTKLTFRSSMYHRMPKQSPNLAVNRTAYKLRLQMPYALRTPGAGYLERWAPRQGKA